MLLQARMSALAVSKQQHALSQQTQMSDPAEEFLAAVEAGFMSVVEDQLPALDDETLHECIHEAINRAAAAGHEAVLKLLLAEINGSIRPAAAMSALKAAVCGNHAAAVRLLLMVPGASFAALHNDVASELLPTAIRHNNAVIVRLLVDAGAIVTQPDKTGQLPLHIAAAHGCSEIVQCLLAAGSGVQPTNQDGVHALELAAGNGHSEAVALLKDCQSEFDGACWGHLDYLAAAAVCALLGDHVDVGNLLLTHLYCCSMVLRAVDLYVDIRDNNGRGLRKMLTPWISDILGPRYSRCQTDEDIALMKAAFSDITCSIDMLHDLTSKVIEGMTTNCTKDFLFIMARKILDLLYNATPFAPARNLSDIAAASHSIKEDLLLLSTKGKQLGRSLAEVFELDHAFVAWSQVGDATNWEELCKAYDGCSNHCMLENSPAACSTLLHLVVHSGHVAALQHFLEAGASTAATSLWRETPLHVAAAAGNSVAVKMLLDAGADVNAATVDLFTPVMVAAMATDVGQVTTTDRHVGEGVVELLVARGADIHQVSKEGCTALHYAVYANNSAAVDILVKAGADITAYNLGGYVPLHIAAALGHEEVAQCLLQFGADVAACSRGAHVDVDRGPIVVQCSYAPKADGQNSDRLEEILKPHTSCSMWLPCPSILSLEHWQPLHLAAAQDQCNLVQLLCQHGASVLALNGAQKSPLDLAVSYNSSRVIELLRTYDSKTAHEGMRQDI